ncbi:MAG: Elongation factor P [Candidatus Ordinivivax streblomastigis]|uniref:Elongation factor P n=1 Tax=Candidatus Ordinivivax streblomastigis TaxID=2540710 RepID=A0A5M8P177_9BACT|nr:MAG: Elongation factor P [Candidatus Ordinivivax streblomastigis]
MASTADFKNGMCIDMEGQYYYIVEFLHVKPGKGPAFVRTKLKNVTTGRVLEKTWNSGVKVDEVRIERRTYQFLYQDGTDYHFMEQDTGEQVSIVRDNITGVDFLKEGNIAEVVVHADSETILFAELPAHVALEVTYTEPGLKGDTATNATKPATMETGATVRVPLFINEGETIKVDTRDGSYVERVKVK